MRGKAACATPTDRITGITPAYAGKSRHEWGVYRANQDHPRLCGEKFKIAFVRFALSGSPPPMRGKAKRRVQYQHGKRITPAYAGKSRYGK